MRVLDIDLDYFLTGLCYPAEPGARPDEIPCESEAFVRRFMEEQAGITRPVPGAVFPAHDGALVFWEDMIAEGRLVPPFGVVHVDAHSDLGIGRPGPAYVLYNVLAGPVEKRTDLSRYYGAQKLDEANYLLFALALRRVSSLVNVRRPFSLPDVPEAIRGDGFLHLPEPFPELFGYRWGREPRVPYREIREDGAYRPDGAFDFVTLALSPRYAPRGADPLARVIREYIDEKTIDWGG